MKQKIILCWLVFMAISAFTNVSGYFRTQKPYKKILIVHSNSFNGIVEAKNVEKQGNKQAYTLRTTDKKTGNKDSVFLKYAVYALQSADINNDGKTDICIGISTPKNSENKTEKTFFVLEIHEGHIRPLMPQAALDKPLETFRVFCRNEKSIIRTIEKENNNTFSVGEYEWENNKLKLLTYKGKNLDLEKAQFVMYNFHNENKSRQ
jgi:hypothetical protein